VEITHKDNVKSVYQNLSPEASVSVGKTVLAGEKIGTVGDSAIIEIADEAHLHFEMLVNGVSVNPLDYLSEESKKSSLLID
jgi:murein DD-endopeptidase MepM/ murein hydrolase activator NlpD